MQIEGNVILHEAIFQPHITNISFLLSDEFKKCLYRPVDFTNEGQLFYANWKKVK